MRILAAADLHYALRQFDWLGTDAPACDLLVLAGDLLDMGSSVDLEVQEVVVQKYLRRYSAGKVLLTSSGNHDIQDLSPTGERTARWMKELGGDSIKSDYDSHEQDGVLFSVCSWWDGPVSRAQTEARLAEDAARAKKAWIWLHHNPPARTPVAWTGKHDGGDPVVVEWIEQYQPDLVFSGHIHNAPFYGEGSWHARIGKTWIFNPGKQIGGEPTRILVDLAARRAQWFSAEGVDTLEL
ncbi:MAG: metallophosphoesterase [Candidatus Methylacidiphilales bacterium]|nr:metallophosphoesterase [Candidatus Methylacidiphilales bacterium]